LTFIDEIIKKEESQPSIGLRKVASRQPTSSLQTTGSPSVAFYKAHNQTREKDFQEIDNSSPKSLQEGNLSNICEGRGETGEIEEPRSPLGIIQPLSIPNKGSVAKIIQNEVEEPQELKPPQTLGTLIIRDKGSAIKAIPVKAIPTLSNQPSNTLLEIPEDYWHIFYQMP